MANLHYLKKREENETLPWIEITPNHIILEETNFPTPLLFGDDAINGHINVN